MDKSPTALKVAAVNVTEIRNTLIESNLHNLEENSIEWLSFNPLLVERKSINISLHVDIFQR